MRIITGADADLADAFVMPTDGELDQLYRIVSDRHPNLALPVDASDEKVTERRISFRNAFLALGSLGRLAEPERKNAHAMSWWVDICREWLECARIERDIDAASFTLAVAAHGDIPHTPLDRWPYDLSFGLQYGGAGRRAVDSWRKVLTNGKILPTVTVAPHTLQPPGQRQVNR
jgi:hypothetical protein